MRSSTSVSKATRAAALLLAGCAVVALAVEGVARVGFDRASKIQRRMADEYRIARAIGREKARARKHVLLIGNSLLQEDVQFDDVQSALAADWDARRFVVEQTFYLDWYYGLRRLFHEGARPHCVVLMLSTRHWIRTESRGDYSAHYLMDMGDLPDAARDLGLNGTQTTNLFLSNVSRFWAARAEMRNFVLARLMPDLRGLVDFSSVSDPNPVFDDDVARIAADRIARLKALAAANGATLVLV